MRTIQSGEQLTISYTDLLQTLDERQQSLMQRYAFKCCCARCADDSAMPGDWFLDAVAADGESHLLLPQSPGEWVQLTVIYLDDFIVAMTAVSPNGFDHSTNL